MAVAVVVVVVAAAAVVVALVTSSETGMHVQLSRLKQKPTRN